MLQPNLCVVKDETAKNFWSKQILILIENFIKQIRSIEDDDDDNKDNNNHHGTKEERINKFQTEYHTNVNLLMEELGVKVYLFEINRKKKIMLSFFPTLVRLNSSAYVIFYN